MPSVSTVAPDNCAQMRERRNVVMVLGPVAPYASRLFDSIAKHYDLDLHVLTCSQREPGRDWQLRKPEHYTLTLLTGRRHQQSGNFFFNPGIVNVLNRIKPDAIIIGSFSPTMMIAALYAKAKGIPLGVSTDGSIPTDPGEQSAIHRWARELFIPMATCGIGASDASLELLMKYKLPKERCEVVPLVPVWEPPAQVPTFHERPYDILFCGGIDERKGPNFFCDVLLACKAKGHTFRTRVAGSGRLKTAMEQKLRAGGIPTVFDGFVQPQQLPDVFFSAKLFLFPSLADAWGLVANEAILCGTPSICSPHATSSVELVSRYGAGRMLSLDVDTWSDAVIEILSNPAQWQSLQNSRLRAQASFSLDRATSAYGRALDRLFQRPCLVLEQ